MWSNIVQKHNYKQLPDIKTFSYLYVKWPVQYKNLFIPKTTFDKNNNWSLEKKQVRHGYLANLLICVRKLEQILNSMISLCFSRE